MPPLTPLAPEALSRKCDPAGLGFESTAELEDLPEIFGQGRAVEALRFGAGIRREGFNLYVLGPFASGKHTTVRQFLERRAAEEPRPDDWCYVNNFDEPLYPKALRLPAGQGAVLRDDVSQFLEELALVLSAAFDTDEYRARRQALEEELKARQTKAFDELGDRARGRGAALLHTPVGFVLAPLDKERVLSPEEFEKLSEEQRKQAESVLVGLQTELHALVHQIPVWEKESREKLRELDRQLARLAVDRLLDGLREKYGPLPEVVEHLDLLEDDLLEHVNDFLRPEEAVSLEGLAAKVSLNGVPPERRYRVNLIVDNSETHGAPVIDEAFPSYQRIVGSIEHRAHLGTLLTDFSLIRAGALHEANGGYLLLDAHRVLTQPFAWEGLKQALRSKEIGIESVGQMFGVASTASLDPEPIPLGVKVVLVGERLLYYLLCQLDPEFNELFKVAVDFDDRIERTTGNDHLYSRLIATLVRKESLLPFGRDGVARVLDHSARLAGDGERLSLRIGIVADLLREADYWARQAGRSTVGLEDVQRGIDAQIARASLLRDRIFEEIRRGEIVIETTGESVGQVNGLSVVQAGRFQFAQPSRITAGVRLGKGEVIDIEREVALGGPIHSKGVLILVGFLGARFGRERPLALSASLVFEQSYGGVEGDSASSAELYALLSALAGAPVRQGIAVTGSVDQRGTVQAVGGVNEKIEGFFDVCRERGLTGEQGVLIPAANVKDLMLRSDVVEAVAAGKFRVHTVDNVDQGIELLTGFPAGARDESGGYPASTINGRVLSRLSEFARVAREFSLAAGSPTGQNRPVPVLPAVP